MSSLLKIVFVITIALVFVANVSGLHAASATNNLQVILRTEGILLIEWFTVTYDIYPTLRTHYAVHLYTLEEDNPSIQVDIIFDKWIYDKDKPTFDQAELNIWSSFFSMENGSSKRVDFPSSDWYYCQYTPKIHDPYGPGSGQYLCSYSFNLSQPIMEAKRLFANATGQAIAKQSNLRCTLQFTTTGLTQGIAEGGQERQLRFDFVSKTHKLEHFSFHFFIPDNSVFIGKQTLNGKEMYQIPTHVSGVDSNDFGYDSSGNPFWMCSAVINWNVPRILAPWETHPVDWILSGLLGFFISSSLIYAKKRLWKPKLSVNIVKKPWVHPKLGIAFYRLTVENKGRTTAHDCKIHITFKDTNKNNLFSLNGKWDKLPEPLGPVGAGGLSRIWPALIPYTENLSIVASDSQTFCLVLKDNEDPCYAYNAHSYLYRYKNPQWQLPIGEFFVYVDITGENTKKHSSFLVKNHGSNIQDLAIAQL